MNSKLKRILCFVLALLTVLSMALPTLAITTTITDEDIPYDFFEYSKDGSWHDLNTPVHRDASGNYAYCIEHMKDPPSNSTQYTDFNAASVFSSTTITGIQAILDHGYPVSTGGLSGSKAHYATANAIRFWIKESAGIGYNFMDPNDPSKVRAKSDSADCWALCMQLLQYARSGATTGGSDGGRVYVSPSQPTWQLGNGQLVTQLGVRSSDGYTIQASHPAVQISGYTGGTNDAPIITAPVSLMGTDVSLFIQGRGSSGQTASLYWYEPSSSSKQSVVVVELTAGGTPDSGYVTITGEFYDLTVKKVDSYTGAALDGAVFQLTSDGDAVGLCSAFGVFFSDEADPGKLKAAIVEINTDFSNDLQAQIDSLSAGGYDAVNVIYEGDFDSDSFMVNNWTDVLGVYAVKTTTDETAGDEVLTVTPEKQRVLESTFLDMNTVNICTEVETNTTATIVDGEEVEETTTTLNILIDIQSMTYLEGAELYAFNEDQMEMLEELMSPQYYSFFAELIDVDIYGGLTASDFASLVNDLPTGTKGGAIAQAAVSKVGTPYSVMDCSDLSQYAYAQAGVSIPGTSVTQAQYCYNNGYTIAAAALQPGDLIFWSKTVCRCGRWNEVHHVAVYIGNGRIVDANSSKGRVVLRDLWNSANWQIVMYARPHVG